MLGRLFNSIGNSGFYALEYSSYAKGRIKDWDYGPYGWAWYGDAFFMEGLKAVGQGGKMNWSDKIIFDLKIKSCQNKILEDVVKTSSEFTNSIRSTFNSNNVTNLRFSSAASIAGIARTAPFPVGNQSSYYISIQFDNSYLNKATNLSLAAAALHEMVHAYLINLYITSQMTAKSDSKNDLFNAFAAFYDSQVEDTANTLDNEIHNAMKSFIEKLSNSLFLYSQAQNIGGVDLDYCRKVIWSTLSGTDLFNQILNEQQKLDYVNIGAIEQDGLQGRKGSVCK